MTIHWLAGEWARLCEWLQAGIQESVSRHDDTNHTKWLIGLKAHICACCDAARAAAAVDMGQDLPVPVVFKAQTHKWLAVNFIIPPPPQPPDPAVKKNADLVRRLIESGELELD